MAKKRLAAKRAGSKAVPPKATGSKAASAKAKARKSTRAGAAVAAIGKQDAALRRENEKLHRQVARFEVANFSLKNRVAALEEILQDYGHIENPRLKRIIEEVQERTRGAGDLLSNGPF